MTKTTDRLGLPIVEIGDSMNISYWNDAHNTIDQKCIAFDNISNITFPKSTTTYTQTIQLSRYQMLEVIPTNPENQAEWNAIALASFRVWIEGTKLNIYCEGIPPSQDVHISILGWY